MRVREMATFQQLTDRVLTTTRIVPATIGALLVARIAYLALHHVGVGIGERLLVGLR